MNKLICSRLALSLMISFLLLTMAFVNQAAAAESILELDQKWTGDFDGMVERHKIRVLVPYSKTFYFLDGARQSGVTYDLIIIFEDWLKKKLARKRLKVHAVIIPTPSEDLLTGLCDGRGDIAAGNLTTTPEREKIVDFSDPFATGAKEIIVVAKATPALNAIEDLSGKEIYIPPSSS